MAEVIYLGGDAAVLAGAGSDHPVVGLEGVHGLEHGGHPPDVGVDLGVGEEVGRQVRVKLRLDAGLRKREAKMKKILLSTAIFSAI